MIPDDIVRYVKEKMPDEKKVHEMIEAFNLGVAAGRAESAGRIEELLDQSARAYADGVADGRREGLGDNPDHHSSGGPPKRKRKVKT